MSSENTNEPIFLNCENNDGTDLVDTFAIMLDVMGLLGGLISYFLQQKQDREDAAEAKCKEDCDLDQALE